MGYNPNMETAEVHKRSVQELCASLDTSSPLAIDQFGQLFPYLVRKVPSIGFSSEAIIFEPQSGEHYRYGVFFYAIPDLATQKQNQPGYDTLIFNTEDILNENCTEEILLKKGIVISNGNYWKNLEQRTSQGLLELNPKANTNSINFNYAVDGGIVRENITLDTNVVGIKSDYPYLSIPAPVSIKKEKLIVRSAAA